MKRAVEILGITDNHGYNLWNKYKGEGLGGYRRLNYRANRAKLNERQKGRLVEWAAQGFASQSKARELIENGFEVSDTQQGISLLFQRLKIKLKVVRPFKIKADESEQRADKKPFA